MSEVWHLSLHRSVLMGPDRIVLLPGGKMAFVEVKALGEKPRPLQLARHQLLRRLGFKVYVLDEESQIGGLEVYNSILQLQLGRVLSYLKENFMT